MRDVTGSLRSLSFITRSDEITFNQHCACVSVYLYTGGEEGILGERSYDDHVMLQNHYPQSDVTSADISLGDIRCCVFHPYKEKL